MGGTSANRTLPTTCIQNCSVAQVSLQALCGSAGQTSITDANLLCSLKVGTSPRLSPVRLSPREVFHRMKETLKNRPFCGIERSPSPSWALGPASLRRLDLRESCPKPSPRVFKILRNDPGLANHRHKIRVANPPWHGVKMQVPGYSRASSLPQVHAEVEPMRPINSFQDALSLPAQVDQLVEVFARHLGQAVEVSVRHHHHVPGSVGVGVQADKARLAAQNQPPRSFGLVFGHAVLDGKIDGGNEIAEDASAVTGPAFQLFWHSRTCQLVSRRNIRVAPWCPKNVHFLTRRSPKYRPFSIQTIALTGETQGRYTKKRSSLRGFQQ